MRSLTELTFRSYKEAQNLWLLARPPRVRGALPDAPLARMPVEFQPDPEEIRDLARQIRAHRIPLLGTTVELAPEIRWRRDPWSGVETGTPYLRCIPYLDAKRAGDHKLIWELNRHQHLVVLAQAGDEESWKECVGQLESWLDQNPFQRGINWASALEVAFRALSWTRIYHLAGGRMEPRFRRRFIDALYRHALHIFTNLSIYFSPNTHLLGEAVVIHALGVLFPGFPIASALEQVGRDVVAAQTDRQVRADGSHFEQSSYYHVYALDMLLFHAQLVAPAPAHREKLARMADFLDALLGPDRVLPFFGDDDGGRWFHPFGPREQFGRATLDAANVYLGRTNLAAGSKMFPDAGLAIMRAGDRQIVFDAGPFGAGGAGHSHSDTLSLVVRAGGKPVLIDPGTYTYTGDPQMRDWFRGSAAHNTVQIDGLPQGETAGPFRWKTKPAVRCVEWSPAPARDVAEAECAYMGFVHRRRVVFEKPDRVLVSDTMMGPAGEHDLLQSWHLGSAEARDRIQIEGGELGEAWRSGAFGEKHLGPVLTVRKRTALPCRMNATIQLGGP
jgi:heparinase II/III-like protein